MKQPEPCSPTLNWTLNDYELTRNDGLRLALALVRSADNLHQMEYLCGELRSLYGVMLRRTDYKAEDALSES